MANPIIRSLYTSADMEKDISITSNLLNRFQCIRGHFKVVFLSQSNGKVTVHNRSADLYIDFTISLDPVDGFWQLKSHFGVIFDGQPNYKVTVHIS